MAQFLQIHPDNPQPRLIKQAAQLLHEGAVVIYPTDSAYALGCHLGDKEAINRIRRIRQLTDKHHLTLVCKDLSALGTYARVTDTTVFRLLKANTPGPYTFLLKATHEVPKQLQHPKRKSIGLRIPDNNIVQALLAELNEPILSTTLIMPGEETPLIDPNIILDQLGNQVDLIIDGGPCDSEPTTVIDLYDDTLKVVREGKGSLEDF